MANGTNPAIHGEIRGISLAHLRNVSGIIGKLSFESAETLGRAVLDRMLDASAHRKGRRLARLCHVAHRLLGRGQQVRGVFAAPGIALGSCAAAETLEYAVLKAA